MSHAAIVRAHGVGRNLRKPRAMAQSKQIGPIRRPHVLRRREISTLSHRKAAAIPVIMPADDEHHQREDDLCR
jgi:hypothetical protein